MSQQKLNSKNNFFLIFLIFNFGLDSLDPVYVRKVKCTGGCEKYYSSKYNVLGQVHELLIRCLECFNSTHIRISI
jgi:hypothetical protein